MLQQLNPQTFGLFLLGSAIGTVLCALLLHGLSV